MPLQAATHGRFEALFAPVRVDPVARKCVLASERAHASDVVIRAGPSGRDAKWDQNLVEAREGIHDLAGHPHSIVPQQRSERHPAGGSVQLFAHARGGSAGLDDILDDHDVGGLPTKRDLLARDSTHVDRLEGVGAFARELVQQPLHQPPPVAGVQDENVAVQVDLLLHHAPEGCRGSRRFDDVRLCGEGIGDDGMGCVRQPDIVDDFEVFQDGALPSDVEQ